MVRVKNVINELEAIKDRYIHGGDDCFDARRRKAIDDAILLLATLPSASSETASCTAIHATFLAGQVFGTILYDDKEYQVYLAGVESYPIGLSRTIDGVVSSPPCLKHKFVLIER